MTGPDEIVEQLKRRREEREQATSYPEPPREAVYHGLAGDVVRKLGPHSEGDPVALLVNFLLAFGNAVGRGPGMQIEGDFHATNEYAIFVGATAKGRKGTARGRVMQLMRDVDKEWANGHQRGGLVSGEGVIWEVRDEITKKRKPRNKTEREQVADEMAAGDNADGLLEELEDAGISDKRLMITEPEFASVLAVCKREGNTLSAAIRDFYDQLIIRTLAKNSPACSTGALVSIIGHITADELRRELTDTAKANGFANRFMFFCVQRSKVLPFGGHLDGHQLKFLVERVQQVLESARDYAGSLAWSKEAANLWVRVYAELSEGKPGLLGAVTARAETHCVHLAVLYALLDGARRIGLPHIEAALALWDYAERSAAYVFGGRAGYPLADHLLGAIRAAGNDGVDRGKLRLGMVSHKTTTAEFDAALSYLERCLLAFRVVVDTGGRPAERWHLVGGSKPDLGDQSPLSSPKRAFIPPRRKACRMTTVQRPTTVEARTAMKGRRGDQSPVWGIKAPFHPPKRAFIPPRRKAKTGSTPTTWPGWRRSAVTPDEIRAAVLQAVAEGKLTAGGPSDLAARDLTDQVPEGYWDRWSAGATDRIRAQTRARAEQVDDHH